jgi:putative transposase
MKWTWRDILDAIFYVNKTGCQWRLLPHDLPPWQTVYRYHRWLVETEWWSKFNAQLTRTYREKEGREAEPSLAIIDSQTTRSTETSSSHGYDGAKKTKGTKRHILVDSLGLLICVVVHCASLSDGNSAGLVFRKAKTSRKARRLKVIKADQGYTKRETYLAAYSQGYALEVVYRNPDAKGLEILPKRWIVERTFSWISRNRRLARDYERVARTSEAFIYISMCRLILRRLTKESLVHEL